MTVELRGARVVGEQTPRAQLVLRSQSHAEVRVVDAPGLVVAPGYVDLQVNGGHGIDLAREPERVGELARRLVEHGVTAWLPTLVSSSATVRSRFLAAVAEAMADQSGSGSSNGSAATILGAHLEGPAISVERRGAHRSEHLIDPDTMADELAASPHRGIIRLVTLAPELPGSERLVSELVAAGVVVSVGHSDADAETVHRAADRGATYATHLFNAMSGLHHREPGVPGAVLSDPRFTAGLIVDGIHLHPDTVRLVWAALGPGRISLVSDATAALGTTATGAGTLADRTTVITDAVRTPDGTLAGTNLALDQAIRNLVQMTACSIDDAVHTVSAVPARLLGIAELAAIAQSGSAVVLEPSGALQATIVDGSIAWERESDRSVPGDEV